MGPPCIAGIAAALLSRLLSTQPRIQAREPIRSADPHDVRGRSAVTVVRDTIEGWRGFANSVQHLRH